MVVLVGPEGHRFLQEINTLAAGSPPHFLRMISYGLANLWPAAGFVDTEIRCLTELESGNAEKEVQPRVQA